MTDNVPSNLPDILDCIRNDTDDSISVSVVMFDLIEEKNYPVNDDALNTWCSCIVNSVPEWYSLLLQDVSNKLTAVNNTSILCNFNIYLSPLCKCKNMSI